MAFVYPRSNNQNQSCSGETFYRGDQNQLASFVLDSLLHIYFLFITLLGTLMSEIAVTWGLSAVTVMRKSSLDNLLSKSNKTFFLHVKSKAFTYFSACSIMTDNL